VVATGNSLSSKGNIPPFNLFLSYFRWIKILTPLFIVQSLSFSEQQESVSHSTTYSIPIYSIISLQSQNVLIWSAPLSSSLHNIEWAPQLWYIYHKCRTFLSPSFCTFIIRQYTYYDAHSYVIILKCMAKYFFQQLLNMWHLYCERVFSRKVASNTTSEIFSHNKLLYAWWFLKCEHYCTVKVIFSVVIVHNVF